MILSDMARSLWDRGDASTWEAEIPGARIQGVGEYIGRSLKGRGFPEEFSAPPFWESIQVGGYWNDCGIKDSIEWMLDHSIHKTLGGQYDYETSI